jgi:(2Fe-2S) ferredoxin
VWYGRVTPADVPEIFEKHILGGVPVERLRIDQAWQKGAKTPEKKPG